MDVRSAPHSRHVTHFNRDKTRRAMEQRGIAYTHMEQLGADPARTASTAAR